MTGIPYCDETLNVTAGCTKCYPGCENCWAEKMAHRLKHICLATNNNPQYLGKTDKDGHWTGKVECCPWLLDQPLKWRKPRRIFVNSMSDLFHPKVPFEFIDKVMFTIYKSYRMGHTILILTKRAKRMLKYFSRNVDGKILKLFRLTDSRYTSEHRLTDSVNLLPRVQLGVSISNQAEADEKIPTLLQIPAAVRWLSIEPMLEDIDLTGFKPWYGTFKENQKDKGLHWVVVGGESGPGARPMHPDWVRSIRDQCVMAGVPFFFKQWGKWGIAEPVPNDSQKRFRIKETNNIISPNTIFKIFPEHEYSTIPLTGWIKVGKKKAGCLLDGREWKQYPKIRK